MNLNFQMSRIHAYYRIFFKYLKLTLSTLHTCMVCSRSRLGLYHSRYLGLIGLNNWSWNCDTRNLY